MAFLLSGGPAGGPFVEINHTGDVDITGTLTVTNLIATTTVSTGDNIIVLNDDVTGAPTEDAGIVVERGTSADAQIIWNETANQWEYGTVGSMTAFPTGAGSGDVVGPASATDNAFARFDLATGKLIQNSTATLSDAGFITLPAGGGITAPGSGLRSERFGSGATTSTFADATAVGYNATTTGGLSIALGSNTAVAANGVAIGDASTTTGSAGIAIGKTAASSSTGTTAIGFQASATGTYSIAMGYQAAAPFSHSVLIGGLTSHGNGRSVAIGYLAACPHYEGVAIGYQSNAGSQSTTAVGNQATATFSYGTAIGDRAAATNLYTVAVGRSSAASGSGAVAIGYSNTSSGIYSISMGRNAVASANYTVALGGLATASSQYATTVGYNASSTVDGGVAIGRRASTSGGLYPIAIGLDSTASNTFAIAIGSLANVAHRSFGVGRSATTTADAQGVFGDTNQPFSDIYIGYGITTSTAAPVALKLNSSGGSGLDRKGEDFEIKPGPGTGSGAGGYFSVLTAPAGASGSTPNTAVERIKFKSSVEAVFNDSGADYDLRIEGDNDANLLFVDAGTDRVGIGASAPSTKLEVEGTSTITGATADGAAAGVTLDPAYSAASAQTVTRHNYISMENVALTNVTLTDACAIKFDAAAGTHKAVDSGTTKAAPGIVDAWMKVNLNGTVYYMPMYTAKT